MLLEVRSILIQHTFTLNVLVCFLLTFLLIWFLHVYSFLMTVFTDPGRPQMTTNTSLPPPLSDIANTSYQHSSTAEAHVVLDIPLIQSFGNTSEQQPLAQQDFFTRDQISMITAKRDGRPRFCQKCQYPKPDRAHHCSTCKRCVLKMDQ